MKKAFLGIIVLLISFNSLKAQEPEFTFGESFSIYDDQTRGLIGVLNEVVMERVFLMENAKLLGGNTFAHQHGVSYHDKTSLKRSTIKSYPLLKANGVDKPEKAILVSEALVGDTLIIFYQFENKTLKKDQLFAWAVNALTLEPFSKEALLLKEVGSRSKEGYSSFYVSHFKESNLIFVNYFNYATDENASTIFLNRYNTTLELQAEKSHKVKGSKFGAGIDRAIFTKNFDLLLVLRYSKKKNYSIDDPRYFTLVGYPTGSSTSSETEIVIEGGNAVNCDVYETAENKLIAVGNFGQIEDRGSEKDGFVGGSYSVDLDPDNLTALSTQEEKFTNDQIINMYPMSNNPNKPNTNRNYETSLLSRVGFLSDPTTGAFLYVTASKLIIERTTTTSSNTTFKSGSVVATYVDKEGKIMWQKVIPRAAFINGMSTGLYTEILRNGNKFYIIFNDSAKNIPVFKAAASKKGKKPVKSSASAVERIEFPSDATPEVYPWNLTNAVYRFNELDAQGNMSVIFYEPELLHKNKKNPILNTDAIIRLGEGDYVIGGLEAGMLGPKNHSLIRIKF